MVTKTRSKVEFSSALNESESMADIANKYAENVSGKFYCDDQCIDCDLCRETAPANFTRTRTVATPLCLSNPARRTRRLFARKPWKDVRSKPSATMAKAECHRSSPPDMKELAALLRDKYAKSPAGKRAQIRNEILVRGDEILAEIAKGWSLLAPSGKFYLVRLTKLATIPHPIHQKCRCAGFALTFLGGCRVRLSAAIHPF